MQYLGGKARVAQHFAPILVESLERTGGYFVEPFVGGFNLVPRLPDWGEAECSDIHAGLIGMYQAIQAGWEPPSVVTEEEYRALKAARGADPLSVFTSFACAWGGKEWSGYARCSAASNYADLGRRKILKALPAILRTRFIARPYDTIEPTRRATIYCDPPYEGRTQYRTGAFDHTAFWAWCDRMVDLGHEVYVSEMKPRDGWDVAWSRERTIYTSGTDGRGAVAAPKSRAVELLLTRIQ